MAKTLVLVLVQRGGGVVATIIPDRSGATLVEEVLRHVELRSTVITNGWRGFYGLGSSGFTHIRDSHLKAEPCHDPYGHLGNARRFLTYMKVRLSKFRGLPPGDFPLHLWETEIRSNFKDQNQLYALILALVRATPMVVPRRKAKDR
jgi:transposase-like protein